MIWRKTFLFEGSRADKGWRKQRGEDPEVPYSGRFVVRVDPELHKRPAIEARKRGVSINALVGEALSKKMDGSTLKK